MHILTNIASYDSLINKIKNVFYNLPAKIKLFYLDSDNDIISISN